MLLVLFHESKELKSNINKEFKPRGVAAPYRRSQSDPSSDELSLSSHPGQLAFPTASIPFATTPAHDLSLNPFAIR
ncbi:hypothetical protein F2Q69_00027986 [Brassica cretica]|uniref:Uncharacterized protein n=1 Tax=Brassica cretica TaxID=69181 RepID=A0A8S9RZJ4_BRACR|nr:hypothetical protein F2Q69_00027986 [Brassica cretica]